MSPLRRIALLAELAYWASRRAEPFQADKLRLLAAAAAIEAEFPCLANEFRKSILAHNPSHAIGRFPHAGAALNNEDFRLLLDRAIALFPVERCERLADQMGIDLHAHCAEFADRRDYFAHLLDASRFDFDDSLEQADW